MAFYLLCSIACLFVSVLLLTFPQAAILIDYLGCYQEGTDSREMNISTGNYDPAKLTPELCARQCQPNYTYAGLWLGRLCFCGDSYGQYGTNETAECDLVCPGDETKQCGSDTHNSIYEVPPTVSSAKIAGIGNNSMVSPVDVIAFSDTAFSLEIEGSGLASLVVEFGDGYTETFTDNTFCHQFLSPGLIHMKAIVLDAIETPYPTAAYLDVHLPVMQIKRHCPVAVLRGEEFDCEFAAFGTGMAASVAIDGIGSFNLTLTDATTVKVGPDLDQTTQPTVEDANIQYVKVRDRVTEDAMLVGWEVVVRNPGQITFVVFRPQPISGKQFCHRTLNYIDASEDCLKQPSLAEHKCSTDQMYSFTKRSCVNTLTGQVIEPDISQPGTLIYDEVANYRYVVNEIGTQFLPLLDGERFDMKAGYLIAYRSAQTNTVHRIQPKTSGDGDVFIAFTGSPTMSVPPNPSTSVGQYLYRAVTVRPSRLHVKGMYPRDSALGPRDIKVAVTNAVSSETWEGVVHVENEIDNVTLTVSEIAATYDSVNLVVDFDGRALAIEWNMGDGTEYNTTENSTVYQWQAAGFYNVTVTVVNHYNSESDTKLLVVQERILALNWTTTELSTPILLGSQARLEWEADSGTDIQYTFEFDWNLGNPKTNLTFGSNGIETASLVTSDWALDNFVIQLTANDLNGFVTFYPEGYGSLSISLLAVNLVSDAHISTSVQVQTAISGFTVHQTLPQEFGADIFLRYELSSGSDVIVDMTLDGFLICGTCITTFLEGQCLLRADQEYFEDGEYEIELTAYNGVSGPEVVMTDLVIQHAFNSSDLVVDLSPGLAVPTGSTLNVTFEIVRGSNVSHEVNFGDGSDPVTGLLPCFLEARSSVVFHVYLTPGEYCCTVLTWNLVSNASYSAKVRVQNPVMALSMVEPVAGDVFGVAGRGNYEIPIVFDFNGSVAEKPTDAAVVFSLPEAHQDVFILNISNNDSYPVTLTLSVPGHGTYAGSATVFNLVSELEFGIAVEVEEFIEDLDIVLIDGFDLLVDEEAGFNLSVSWGSRITFQVDFGDGLSTVQYSEKRGLQVSHIFSDIGEFVIQVNATNILGSVSKTVVVRLFRRVEGFSLKVPSLNRLPLNDDLTIAFLLYITKDVLLPNNATISVTFDNGGPFVDDLMSGSIQNNPELDTATKFHVRSFPHTYNVSGRFTVAASISNPASSQDLSHEFWIYEAISEVEAVVKYNEFDIDNFTTGDPMSDQPAIQSDGLYTPLDHAVVLVATYATGNRLTFTWDFGETPGVYSVTQEPREIYWYQDPGTYKVTLNVSNPGHYVVTNVTVHVQVPVTDVTLTLLDIGDKTSNVTMYFEVQVASLGTDACYRVDFRDSQIVPVVYFGSEQICLATYKTEIDYSEYPFVFDSIDFQGIWEETGGPWGFNITNIYDHYGPYNINITGSNVLSSSTFMLPQYVMKPDCFNPMVSVNESNRCDGVTYKCDEDTDFRVYLASVHIFIVSKVSLNCKSSNKAWYDWTVSFLGDSLSNEGQSYSLPDDVVTAGLSVGSLSIEPATLTYGWYRFELNVSMYEEYPPIFGIDSTFIRIDPSPLEVHIYGGDERAVSHNNTITVDAETLTYDPDIPRDQNSPDDFRFVWLCRRKSYYSTKTLNTTYNVEPFEVWDKFYNNLKQDASDNKNDEIDASDSLVGIKDRGGCFGLSTEDDIPAPGGKLKYETSKVAISTAAMYYNMEYELKVAVIKGERVGEATQTLDINEGRPPILLTFCKVNCKSKLNPSNRYSLESQEAFGSVNFFSLYYEWNIYMLVDGLWSLVPVEEWIVFARTPQDRANFVMDPGFFEESKRYQLKLKGSRNPDFSNSGKVSVIVHVNDRPRDGNCSISPPEGQALLTNFDIWCEGWTDVLEDLPLSYTFKVEQADASSAKTIHASSSSRLSQPTKLNQGLPERDCKVTITIDVTDNLGCFKSTSLAVKVYPPASGTDVTEQLDAIGTDMQELFASGDKESGSNLVMAAADFLNTEAANNATGGADGGGSGTMDPSASQARTEMRANMAEMLSEATVTTVEGVQQLSSAMAALTKVPEEVSQEARTSLVGSMEEYSKVLEKNSMSVDPISVETLESTTALCMEVIENIVEAAETTPPDVENMETAVGNMEMAQDVVDRLASTISGKMVLGQSDLNVTSAKSALILAKSPALWIGNKNFSAGDGNYLQLPQYEDLFQDLNNFTAVTQKFIVRDHNPKMFAAGAAEVNSVVVTLTLINDTDQTPLGVMNTTSPIEISIARAGQHTRTNDSSTATELYINQTAPVGGNMVVHQIDVPLHNALSLEVRALGTDDMEKGLSYDVVLYVFLRKGGIPSLEIHDLNCTLRQTVTVVDDSPTSGALPDLAFDSVVSNDSETRCFFSSAVMDTFQNDSSMSFSFGVNHEVLKSVSDDGGEVVSSGSLDNSRFHPMVYAVTTSLYTCLAIGDTQSKWSTEGCQVGENSTDTLTQCFCSHLTMFGGGFRIPINKIDLSDSAFLKLDENPVVFIFMMCCLCLYVLVIFWARKADKRDFVKAGITPLPDNDPRDRYLYEITVYTGVKRNAGTTASVTILMSGELGESAPRVLRDPKCKVFQAGGVDSFLLASPTSLGNLVHMRVWHDNKGKRPSWYLARIMVKDLQQDRTFYFVADRWLAVEEDDGMIERVIPVAGRSELTSFGHLFYTKTRRNLSDSHIWFSVFTRPVKSKFTRVQRATCCLSLLFCTMMANIFFYGQDFQEVEGNQMVLTIGPISFTFGEVIIGVISSLMVLPVNLIVVQLFRLSRPIPACCCKRKGQTRNDKFRRLSTISKDSRAMSDLEKELARMEAKETSRSLPSISLRLQSRMSMHSSSTMLGQNPTPDTNLEETFVPTLGFKKIRKIKQGLELPWGFCVLAWVLVAASVGVAFWLTIEVAGQFGRTKSTEWLMSMCFSLIQDIFFTQPIKVLLLALFFSLIIRDPEKEENSNLAMAPHLQDDEEWLHTRMTAEELRDPANMARLQRLKDEAASRNLAPLHPEELEEARNIRFKEIKMHKIIREIVFYLIFLNVTMLICFGDRDPNVFYINKSMADMFVKASYNGRMLFTKIRGRDNFWNYTENVFIPSLYSYNWYNGEPDLIGREENFQADNSMHLVGRARFRQLRVQRDACVIPPIMENRTHDCRASYSIGDEDATDYDVGWQPVNTSDPPNYADRYRTAWKYHHWYEISSFPYYGKHSFYNGGGYIIELADTLEENLDLIADLRRDLWVDQHTRAVFLEFVVYNANINMYATSFLLVEFLPQGGALPYPYFWAIRLDRYIGTFAYFVIAGQAVFSLFILYFLFREVRNILKEKKAYFKSMWNLVEICILSLAVASIVFYLYRLFVGKELMEQWQKHPHMFLNFHFVAYWDQLYGYISGFVLFLVNVKFIRLLRFNRRLLLFSMTLRKCSKDIGYYSIVFGVVFIAFALFAYDLFHLDLLDFSTFVSTLEELFTTILGKFDFQNLLSVHDILGPLFFFSYVIIIVFVMLNMFLSIINETFGKVRHDNEALENELEIVEFMIQRFKRWSGISERRLKKEMVKTYNYVEEIDPKDVECKELRDKLSTMVDRLNQFIRAERGLRKSEDRLIFISN